LVVFGSTFPLKKSFGSWISVYMANPHLLLRFPTAFNRIIRSTRAENPERKEEDLPII
tara:strand:+ start:954 stop:1127 length:174 start_codon:yes stop_codon:yes gene_type:complete